MGPVRNAFQNEKLAAHAGAFHKQYKHLAADQSAKMNVCDVANNRLLLL